MFVWILGAPVLNSKYFVISIPGLLFDFHFIRILFFIFAFLIVNHFYKFDKYTTALENNKKVIENQFEIWLILYIAVLLFSIFLNTLGNHLSLKYFVSTLISHLFIISLYACLKVFSSHNLLYKLKITITRFSLIFSIIAIIQTFIISNFFRFGELRLAIGETFRASGIFNNEYTFAFFCITSLVILLVDKSDNFIVMGVISFALFLTFHRLSIAILIISFIIYSYFFKHRKRTHLFIYTLCLSSIVIIFYLAVFENYTIAKFKKTQIYINRLSIDTVYARLDQYKNAINIICNYPFGFGSYESERYINTSAEIGQLHLKRIYDYDNNEYTGFKIAGHIVHNSFLGAGAKYGFLGMITYFMFCFSSTIYAFRIYKRFKNENSIIFLSICICWLFFQTSQDFSDFKKYHNIYFLIIIGVFANHFNYKSKYLRDTFGGQ